MKFTVNGIKSFRGREGYGFNANLLMDGKKIAFVMDDANGGEYHFDWMDYNEPRVNGQGRLINDEMREYPMTPFQKAFNDHVNSLVAYDSEVGKMYASLDTVMGQMVDEADLEKKYKKLCRSKTIFQLKGDEKGTYRTINVDYKMFKMAVLQKLDAKYGKDYEIINERFN